jgi:hypothetical protein
MNRLSTKYLLLGMILGSSLLLAGCGNPIPPERPNVRLADDSAYLPQAKGPGDVVLVAQITASKEYGQQRMHWGNWITHWYLVKAKVLSVRQGQWTGGDLVFTAADAWPTSQSGIMVDKAPWPYKIGAIFAISLDTSEHPPVITDQEELPPDSANP